MDLPQRKTIRKQWYDYNSSGAYFITICTKDREPYFGEIKNKKMMLNELWIYVWQCRNEIPTHFPLVEISEFVCMPDHVHGILTINRRDATTARPNNEPARPDNKTIQTDNRTAHDAVPTENHKTIQYGSLGYIINQFKGAVTKFAKHHNIPFARQSRFYDHIIVEDDEYISIQKYIQDNPQNREQEQDEKFPKK